MVVYHSHFAKPLDYQDIIYKKEGKIARIIFNRPEKMNPLRHILRGETIHALKVAETDPEVSVIIIKGNGRCFSAGHDLGGGNEGLTLPDVGARFPGPGQWQRHLGAGYFSGIWDNEKPVIAQAHGYCLAGATELASFCDLFVVSEDCQIGYPPMRAMAVTNNMWFPWHMHMRKAKEMCFTGDSITGTEAVEIGLANYAVPAEELDAFTTKLANRIALVPSSLLALSKRSINKTYEIMGMRVALEVSNVVAALNPLRPDAGEFARISKEFGLKAALNWRDEKFGDYGTKLDVKQAREARLKDRKPSTVPVKNLKGVGEEEN
ncbi:MAG: enoyl-CoA hydratase [Dehalococcoidia bacterium]|nr:enoyl-CoA hydratase [Dehalococcoidia bacterium]